MTLKLSDFYEEDEPVADVVAAFESGTRSCEFSTGTVHFDPHKPTVELCGKPGTPRTGVMWCEVYACDECYSRWLDRKED